MEATDLQLIQKVLLNQDQRAFSYLVNRYQSAVRNSVRQWTHGDDALADDVAQETFIKAYRKLSQFKGDSKFMTWLYRIAYNTFLNHKAKMNLETENIDDQQEQASHEQTHRAGTEMDLEKAMNQLPEAQRQAIHLCLQKGFSHSEAAEILEIPIGTVKTNINRGKKVLMELMSSYMEAANG